MVAGRGQQQSNAVSGNDDDVVIFMDGMEEHNTAVTVTATATATDNGGAYSQVSHS